MNVSKWLRGSVFASPSRSYVRVQIERLGMTGEVYITRKQARELHDRLGEILSRPERLKRRP